MANDTNVCSNFTCEPWQVFMIDAKQYIMKTHFSELSDSYEFCISDFKMVWYEKLDENMFKARAKELNPNIEAKMSFIMKHIRTNIQEQKTDTTYHVRESKENNGNDKLVLHLKAKLQAGVPFAWEFKCHHSDEEMASRYLIHPLVAMVAELHRRQCELQNLLKKKDKEIQDYKESEVKLTHRSLETKPFDEDTFNRKMTMSAGFDRAVAHAGDIAFAGGTQDLYKRVMTKRERLKERGFSETELTGEASLFANAYSPNVSPQSSPITTPVTSPAKTLVGNSSNKARELERREQLKRKLADEAARKKKKKKQIKL